MQEELEQHKRDTQVQDETRLAQENLQMQKYKLAPKKRPEKVDYLTQVRAALIRDYQQRWGDQW